MNCRMSFGSVLRPDRHTLTRESQEVRVGLTLSRSVLTLDTSSRRFTVFTATPHSGQLNIATSTLSNWMNPAPRGTVNSKVISVNEFVVLIVSS